MLWGGGMSVVLSMLQGQEVKEEARTRIPDFNFCLLDHLSLSLLWKVEAIFARPKIWQEESEVWSKVSIISIFSGGSWTTTYKSSRRRRRKLRRRREKQHKKSLAKVKRFLHIASLFTRRAVYSSIGNLQYYIVKKKKINLASHYQLSKCRQEALSRHPPLELEQSTVHSITYIWYGCTMFLIPLLLFGQSDRRNRKARFYPTLPHKCVTPSPLLWVFAQFNGWFFISTTTIFPSRPSPPPSLGRVRLKGDSETILISGGEEEAVPCDSRASSINLVKGGLENDEAERTLFPKLIVYTFNKNRYVY